MSVEIETHSDPVPAPDAVREAHARHSVVDDRPSAPALSTDEIFSSLDERVKNTLQPFENNVMDANRIEGLKRKLFELPHISSVGVSVVDELCTVAVQVFVHGMESWIHSKFPAFSLPNVVDQGENPVAAANMQEASRMRGKGMSGDDRKATEPYAEAPYDAEKKSQRKSD